MPVNFSASSNDSLLPSTSLPLGLNCLVLSPGLSIFITYAITNLLLLLPLCILVLCNGFQRWRKQDFSSVTATTTSHSKSFTYHVVVMELIHVSGSILCCYGIYRNHLEKIMVWFLIFSFTWYGETFFHLLTCLEHYLAVVHPITYLSLKKQRGIRNVAIGCIWLLSIGGAKLIDSLIIFITVNFCLLISSVIFTSFCSLSVLCVLIHPGPGEQGRDRARVDQSKHRAFYTILAMLSVLLLRCAWALVWAGLFVFKSNFSKCTWISGEIWFNLPGSLVLPLLFLQRKACCKKIK